MSNNNFTVRLADWMIELYAIGDFRKAKIIMKVINKYAFVNSEILKDIIRYREVYYGKRTKSNSFIINRIKKMLLLKEKK